jgi:hypothetical protein
MVTLVREGLLLSLLIAPPSLPDASFSEKVTFVWIGLLFWLYIPAPNEPTLYINVTLVSSG